MILPPVCAGLTYKIATLTEDVVIYFV